LYYYLVSSGSYCFLFIIWFFLRMVSVGIISLYREKTSLMDLTKDFDLATTNDNQHQTLRSNRIPLTFKGTDHTDTAVVRGQTIASTLRLAAIVIETYLKYPSVLRENKVRHIAELWEERITNYEKDYHPKSWVSVHYNGKPFYSHNMGDTPTEVEDPFRIARRGGVSQLDAIEYVARGGDLNDSMIMEATNRLLGQKEDIVVHHESQTAVVFTPFSAYLRCAVLERREGRTGSFSFSAHHNSPQKRVRYSAALTYCADLIEAVLIRSSIERNKDLALAGGATSQRLPHTAIIAMTERLKQLQTYVNAFENAYKISFRPERPNIEL
jgi:hypothetical protein